MPGPDHFSRLPDDVVASILIRLPPKTIALARLVCRRWHALRTDHLFVRASFFSHGRPISGFFFNRRYHPWWAASEYFPLDSEAHEEAAAGYGVVPDLSFIPGALSADPGVRVQVRGSCGGLLLLLCLSHCQAVEYYVCNPLTKKLLPIVFPLPIEFTICVNIAFDTSKSQHYKVIAVDDTNRVHEYSSETQSWFMANLSDHSRSLLRGICPTHGVFWDGSVIWIVAHSLVRFIIEGESVTKMPMPSRGKDWICAYIGESGGHLQMVGYTKKEKLTACFDILEMEKISRSGQFCIALTSVE